MKFALSLFLKFVFIASLFSQGKFVENAIKSNTKNGDFYLVSVPEKKGYTTSDIEKFCKENNYDYQNIRTRTITLYGVTQTVVTSFEVIDKTKNAELAVIRAKRLKEAQLERIRSCALSLQLTEYIAALEAGCSPCSSGEYKGFAMTTYHFFEEMEATPRVVNALCYQTVSHKNYWTSLSVTDDVRAIGKRKEQVLISKVKSYIQSKNVSMLNQMNSEGFKWETIDKNTLLQAKAFCTNCTYISSAIAYHEQKEKEERERAEREAIAYERRRQREQYNTSSSSSDNSSSSTCVKELKELTMEDVGAVTFMFSGREYRPSGGHLYGFKCQNNSKKGYFIYLTYDTTRESWYDDNWEKGWYFYDNSNPFKSYKEGPFKSLEEVKKETCDCN